MLFCMNIEYDTIRLPSVFSLQNDKNQRILPFVFIVLLV